MLAAYKNLTLAIVNLVNAPRGYTYHQYRDKLLLKPAQRQQLVDTAKSLAAQQLALGTLGELSLRLSATHLAINTRGSHLAHLAENDIVTCSTLPGKPGELAAAHLSWHRLIYEVSTAQAVLLSQPKYALTLANAGRLPLPRIMPEIFEVTGGVTLLSAHEFSETSLADTARQGHVILIPHLGAIVWGSSLPDTLARAEALEYISQLTVMATAIPNLETKSAIFSQFRGERHP